MASKTIVRGTLLLLFATISWGAVFPVAKPLLPLIDGVHMTLFRYGIGTFLFAAVLIAVEGPRRMRFDGRFVEAALFGTLGFAGFSLLMFTGLTWSRPEHAAIIMATMPLITVLTNWLFRGLRPAPATVGAVALAMVGVSLVVTRGRLDTLGDGAGIGDLLILAGAACWVLYTLGAPRFPAWSSLRYTALTSIPGAMAIVAAAVIANALSLAHAPDLATFTGAWKELAYVLIAGSVGAAIAWNTGVRLLGALDAVLFINVVPLTALTIGLLQGHTLGVPELTGAVLIVVALIVSNFAARRATAPMRVASVQAAQGCKG